MIWQNTAIGRRFRDENVGPNPNPAPFAEAAYLGISASAPKAHDAAAFAIESRRAPCMLHYLFTVNCSPGFLSCSPQAESGIDEHRAAEDG
jgi:hypothetical protein